MRLRLCFLTLVLALACVLTVRPHTLPEQPEENWMRPLGLYSEQYLFHRYDRYSQNDLEKFKTRVANVLKAGSQDGWEGSYLREDEAGIFFSRISWSKGDGYFSFGIETCYPELRRIDFGRIISDQDTVRFVSEFPKRSADERYVKVRWGHRRYLVAEESLAAFMEKAAGLYVEPENNEDERFQLWSDYWVTSENDEDPVPTGLPQLPDKYKHLSKAPLTAKVSSSAKRQIRSDVQHGWTFYTAPSAVYELTFSTGSNAGLKKGMVLISPATQESVFITSVSASRAKGELVRAIDDETKADHCLNDDAEKLPCPRIRVGDIFSTPVGKFWF